MVARQEALIANLKLAKRPAGNAEAALLKRVGFTEEQIIAFLREQEAGD